MRSFHIRDNVCTPYKLLLVRMGGFLTVNGWTDTPSAAEADVLIVGCCGAFHSLENEALGLIREAKQAGGEVVVFGCLARISPEKVKALCPDRILPAPDWESIEALIERPAVPLDKVPVAHEFRLTEEYRIYDPGKKFVLIQTGCSSDCPYCPHKLGIGNLRSRPAEEIIRQVNTLTQNGAHTIILTGNDTGSYGTDGVGITYPDLLRRVLPVAPWLHLSQLNADWVHWYRDDFFPLLRHPKIKDFQVLIQTASDRLLRLMERQPVVRSLRPKLADLRRARPDLILRTDVIIGYPTATKEEERETLAYVAELFDEVAVHAFERFPHTRIETMGLPFYSAVEIEARVNESLRFLAAYPNLLVHRGGQVYQTLVDIEESKEALRGRKQTADVH